MVIVHLECCNTEIVLIECCITVIVHMECCNTEIVLRECCNTFFVPIECCNTVILLIECCNDWFYSWSAIVRRLRMFINNTLIRKPSSCVPTYCT